MQRRLATTRAVTAVAALAVVAAAFVARPPMILVFAALLAVVVATLPPAASGAVLRRLPAAAGVVVAVTFLVFVGLDILPNNTRTTWGELDRQLVTDYLRWLGAAAGGDLGVSRGIGEPVTTALARTLPVTLLLVLYTQLAALAVSVPLALWSAAKEGSWFDRTATTATTAMVSVPVFVSAVAVQLFLVIGPVHVGPIPIGGSWLPAARFVTFGDSPWQHVRSMILPTLTLTISVIPSYVRTLRAEVLETLRADFVASARSRGLRRRRLLLAHVLRPSASSVVVLAAGNVGVLVGYVFIIDEMFSRPGVGDYLQTAVARRDRPAVVGVVAAITALVVVVNLCADAMQLALDPRVEPPRRRALGVLGPRRGAPAVGQLAATPPSTPVATSSATRASS